MSKQTKPERREALFIEHMPQVFIDVADGTEVEISVSSINDDFRTVDNEKIRFPRELAQQIGEALVRIGKGETDVTR